MIKSLTAVELEYLGLSRFESVPSSHDPADEDAFAMRLLSLGAQWWTDIPRFDHHLDKLRTLTRYDFHFPPDMHIGYPSTGGVLVLKYSEDDRGDNEDWRKASLPQRSDDFRAKLGVAFTMDERCSVLSKFGAQFFTSVGDCADIPKSLSEAHERAKSFEALLLRMENPVYLDHWLDTGEVLPEYGEEEASSGSS